MRHISIVISVYTYYIIYISSIYVFKLYCFQLWFLYVKDFRCFCRQCSEPIEAKEFIDRLEALDYPGDRIELAAQLSNSARGRYEEDLGKKEEKTRFKKKILYKK